MNRRLLGALCLVPLIIFVVIGGWANLFACVAVSVIAMFEFYRGFTNINLRPNIFIGYGFYILWIAIVIKVGFFTGGEGLAWAVMLWLFLAVAGTLLYSVFSDSNDVFEGPLGLLGTLYIGLFMSHFILIERTGDTAILRYLVLIASSGSDICAYYTGLFIGKHPLNKKVSPKKTVEGSLGGVVGSLVLCTLFGLIFARQYILHCALIGIFGSVFSELGDLVASAFKRRMGIKDFGDIIPGHGGMLDRFDSWCFCAPLVYYYIILFIR
ncbi:MAG: phosphatidate cytidylyltransferase [Firmicutes bacterium]|nr:phosphatidate cytidylyltransferase [Bacillota bacterium]